MIVPVILLGCIAASLELPVDPRGEAKHHALARSLVDDILHDKDGKSGNPDPNSRWPDATVPYEIDRKFSASDVKIIIRSMKLITEKTCITFPKVDKSKDKNWLYIKKGGPGCASWVGIHNDGANELNLEDEGCMYPYIISHEMIHAIGFDHEMVRPDRDDYIRVIWDNIPEKQQFNFYKNKKSLTFDVPYDYKSLMHYGAREASPKGRLTMTDADGNEIEMSNKKGLTASDALKINRMYKCEE